MAAFHAELSSLSLISPADVECDPPPPAPLHGARVWNGNFSYGTAARFVSQSQIGLEVMSSVKEDDQPRRGR